MINEELQEKFEQLASTIDWIKTKIVDLQEEKGSVIYDNKHKKFKVIKNYRCQEIIKLPYFKSEKIANQFIDEFGEEIKEVFY